MDSQQPFDNDVVSEDNVDSVEGENETVQGDVQGDVDDESPTNKRARTCKAECWKVFTKIGLGDDGIPRAKCNGCGEVFKAGGKDYGTSTLNRHMKKCKKIKYADVGQVMIDLQGKLKTLAIDNKVSRGMCADAIIMHDLPYNFVEFQKIRDWLKYLNPDFVPISRNTAKADVTDVYNREKEILKKELTSIHSRISLTSDLWTACTSEGYICLTAHYVDSSWNLKSRILNFCHMPPPHTGFELSKKILEFVTDWGIEKKIFSLTLDNASSNDVMQAHLKRQLVLQNSLLCDGEFFHVRCSAHILNLIVQEGLKVIGGALEKIRESVKYVKGSEGRMKKFKECIELIGGVETSAGLSLDVSTRWNSTYLMLQSALKYQRVFASLSFHDDNYKVCPSEEEWKRAEKICAFLLPFYETTNLISGTSYPTSNLYFLQIWKIQCVLIEGVKDEDKVVKSMAEKMLVKFEKYWDDYSVVLALGAVLDPRMKLSTLEYCYSKVDPLTSQFKVEEVKKKLYILFENYSSIRTSTPSSSARKVSSSHGLTQSLFSELKVHKQQLATPTGKSQLDVYLDEPSLDLTYHNYDDLNILQWWKENWCRFKDLSLMARDVLGIPITTVASESAFSIGSIILNKYRSRLLSKNVEALICTRNWLHGFTSSGVVGDDQEKDVGCMEPTVAATPEASNVYYIDD